MDRITVAVAQFLPVVGDKEKNFVKMEQFARQAKADHHADLLLYPETALTGCEVANREQAMEVGEPLDGEYMKRFMALSKELDMDLAVPFIERDGEKCYNTLAVCEPDGNFGYYRKTHLPGQGCDCFIDRGDECVVMDTRFGKIGLMICYDLRFPEVARVLALKGARLILCPSCHIGSNGNAEHEGTRRFIELLTKARAYENRVFLLYSDWMGVDDHNYEYLGMSRLTDVLGRVLVDAGKEECIVSRLIDLSLADDKDVVTPWSAVSIFSDRYPEVYGKIAEK